MANVAYVRVSTVEQNEERQIEALKNFNIEQIFTEKVSGKDTNRPKLKELLNWIRSGDVIYTESFSRIARNTRDLLDIVEAVEKKGAVIKSLKENLDTSTPTGKMMLTVIGAMATFERDIMLERQREGIALAKKQGKYKGRNKKEKPVEWENLLALYNTRKITAVELAERCKVSRPVLYRWLKETKI